MGEEGLGSTRHASHLVFVRVSKRNNNGKGLQFIESPESCMGGEGLELLHLLCLKDTLTESVASKVFSEMKAFHYIGCILKKYEYWN